MWNAKILEEQMDKYIDHETKLKLLASLKDVDSLHLMEEGKSQPYLEGFGIIKVSKYNPDFGDDRTCECGHSYHRHFDSYEDMDAVGCKYCVCRTFQEKTGIRVSLFGKAAMG